MEPTVSIDPPFTYKLSSMSENLEAHEAGFDAMATGFVFLKTLQTLGVVDKFVNDSEGFDKTFRLYKNRMPLNQVRVPFNFEDVKDSNIDKLFKCTMNSKSEKVYFIS